MEAWRNKKQKIVERTVDYSVVISSHTTQDHQLSNLSIADDTPKTYSRGIPEIRYEAIACSSSSNTVESVTEQAKTVDFDWPQPDSETEAYQLTVERTSSDNLSGLEGYRIVDLKHVIQWAFQMENHRQSCESSQIEYISEQRKGFHSLLTFKCSMCNKIWQQSTEKKQKINTAFVWATVTAGSYYTQAAHITSLMDIPTMTGQTFRLIEKQLGNVWHEHLAEEIKKAGEQERSIAIDKGNVSSDGIPYITVYVDGGWLKRSYGHNFDSSSGMACIIGKETKKCLYLGVRNKYCYTCQYYERTGSDAKSHG